MSSSSDILSFSSDDGSYDIDLGSDHDSPAQLADSVNGLSPMDRVGSSSSHNSIDEDQQETDTMNPRAYQREMLEESLERNVIVAVGESMRYKRLLGFY
jgi:hypothetical protein